MTCRTLEEFYHIDGHTFEKQYKEVLSGFRDWDQLEHADKWLLFPDNIGTRIAIDESSLSNGELYTFVTNRDARTREKSLIARAKCPIPAVCSGRHCSASRWCCSCSSCLSTLY